MEKVAQAHKNSQNEQKPSNSRCLYYNNPLMHNVPSWSNTLKILEHLLQYFQSVPDHLVKLKKESRAILLNYIYLSVFVVSFVKESKVVNAEEMN